MLRRHQCAHAQPRWVGARWNLVRACRVTGAADLAFTRRHAHRNVSGSQRRAGFHRTAPRGRLPHRRAGIPATTAMLRRPWSARSCSIEAGAWRAALLTTTIVFRERVPAQQQLRWWSARPEKAWIAAWPGCSIVRRSRFSCGCTSTIRTAPTIRRSRFAHSIAIIPTTGKLPTPTAQLGRLIAWLKQNRLYDNTAIVLLSDHGESLGEHGEKEHGFFVYNSTIHVPLLIKPTAGTRGQRVERRG